MQLGIPGPIPRLTGVPDAGCHIGPAGGYTGPTGDIFRIGHLGYVSENDIGELLVTIGKAIPQATP